MPMRPGTVIPSNDISGPLAPKVPDNVVDESEYRVVRSSRTRSKSVKDKRRSLSSRAKKNRRKFISKPGSDTSLRSTREKTMNTLSETASGKPYETPPPEVESKEALRVAGDIAAQYTEKPVESPSRYGKALSPDDILLLTDRINRDTANIYIREAFSRIGFLPSPLYWERDDGRRLPYDELCDKVHEFIQDKEKIQTLAPILHRIVPGYSTNAVASIGILTLAALFTIMNSEKL